MGSRENTEKRSSIGFQTFLSLMFALVLSLVGQADCLATTVSFQWNPVTAPDLAGYRLYYAADSNVQPFNGTGATEGASPVDVHSQTTATLSGLDPGRTYYFAVTAYSTSGAESSYSTVITLPEQVPPVTSITYPTNTSVVSGTVSVTASATDNIGVTKIEFYVNGVLQATDIATPYVFSWNTATLSPGTYTLATKAYDAAGNVGGSENVSVTIVNDTTPPVVTLAAPLNNATVRGTTTITANASDNVGVARVEFYAAGTLLSATNVAPYSYTWDTTSVTDGWYTLTAKAYDAAGNATQSVPVAVSVLNATTLPLVTLTAPVSGTTLVGLAFPDNSGVTKVEFYVNGNLQATETNSPYNFSWDTSALSGGEYTLTAKFYDSTGSTVQPIGVTMTVSTEITVSGTLVL